MAESKKGHNFAIQGLTEKKKNTCSLIFCIDATYKPSSWKQLTERDHREWKLSAIDPHDRDTWRSGVRSAMHAASQLPGRGPTVVDMAPIPAS